MGNAHDRSALKEAIVEILRIGRGIPVSQPDILSRIEPEPTVHQVRMACAELEEAGVIERPAGMKRRWVLVDGLR